MQPNIKAIIIILLIILAGVIVVYVVLPHHQAPIFSGTPGSGSTSTSPTGGSSGGSGGNGNPAGASGPVDTSVIPSTFFGFVVHKSTSMPPLLSYGTHRVWDDDAQWPETEIGSNQWDWKNLDAWLAAIKQEGKATDVLYTMMRTPSWADTSWQSANPTLEARCNYLPEEAGACGYWSDLNWDGTGNNFTWDVAIATIAQHVNNPTYLQTHAHIDYWGVWDEIYRSTTLVNNNPWTGQLSWEGSYAQLVRMYQDEQCIITGRVSVITTNNNESCADLRNTLNQNFNLGLTGPIDPTAQIMSPGGVIGDALYMRTLPVVLNFLYCNSNPPAGSSCTTGDAGAQAVDLIDLEAYPSQSPEQMVGDVDTVEQALAPAEQAKPLFTAEGRTLFSDPAEQASGVARWYLLLWAAGVKHAVWYAYDDFGKAPFINQDGTLNSAGIAYEQVYSWMVGSVMSSPCANTSGSLWTCGFTRSDGTKAEVIWDSASTCSGGVCSTKNVSIPSGYTSYEDLTGHTTPVTGNSVPVGLEPIFLVAQ